MSQIDFNEVLVSWTPSDGVNFYTLYFQQGNNQRFRRVDGDKNFISLILNNLDRGVPYTFSITAHTSLQSTESGPVNITLGMLLLSYVEYIGYIISYQLINVFFYLHTAALRANIEFPNTQPVVGSEYSLQCTAEVYGNLSGNVTITWRGPGALPTPVISPSEPRRSILTFSPLRLSNGGWYSCSVHVEDFLQMGKPLSSTHSLLFRVFPDFPSMVLTLYAYHYHYFHLPFQ